MNRFFMYLLGVLALLNLALYLYTGSRVSMFSVAVCFCTSFFSAVEYLVENK